MGRIPVLIALSALLMLVSACGSPEREPEDAAGLWGSQEQGQPWLELSAQGKLAGSDGCNNLMSNWSQEAEKISFTPIASTMMYCHGVHTWLAAADHATIEDGTLLVFDATDQQIGTLKRANG